VEDPETRRRRAWTVVVFAAVALGGAALQARGALVPSFATEFGVTESQLGLLTPAGTVGFVAPVVVVGALAGRLDMKTVVAVGLALTGLTLILIGTAPTYLLLLVFVVVRSGAAGLFRGLDRPILSHLYPDDRGRAFTQETMAWAAGATMGPFLVTAALAYGDWRTTYYALGAAFLPLAAVAWRIDLPTRVGNERSFALGDFRALFDEPAIVGMGLALVLVGGVESTFFTWLPYYAGGFLPRATANLSLSVYLAAYVPGRLGFSLIADRVSAPDVVLAGATALVGILTVMLGESHPRLLFLGLTFAAGLVVSGFFPLLLTWGVEASPDFTGPVNAFALVAAQAGFLIVPATVGVLAERSSIGEAMLVQVGLAAALVALLGGRRLLGAVRS
jgi:predicted MFS family arabinose efflux permease